MKIQMSENGLIDPISNKKLSPGDVNIMNLYCDEIESYGFDYAIALATEAEVKNGSACGQLALITN